VRFQPLASGSKGNATLVELAGQRLLVDAGISARALVERLEHVGVAPAALDAIVLTHEHEDHARGARHLSVKHRVPVICSAETLDALGWSPAALARWEPLVAGHVLDLGAVRLEPFPVPHDASAPVGFVLHGEGLRLGIATDLGHATTLVVERLRACHVIMIETNHDERLLRDGPYPWSVKQRVSGRLGHLSNVEAADLLRVVARDDCRAVVLAHLSEHNNRAALARQVCSMALASIGRLRLDLRVARQAGPTAAIQM
jgi:phosphoribosyl 1,2-cyclic phosphodiesterase